MQKKKQQHLNKSNANNIILDGNKEEGSNKSVYYNDKSSPQNFIEKDTENVLMEGIKAKTTTTKKKKLFEFQEKHCLRKSVRA